MFYSENLFLAVLHRYFEILEKFTNCLNQFGAKIQKL
jgi:hypothetical protein